jgi:hypothetical protein
MFANYHVILDHAMLFSFVIFIIHSLENVKSLFTEVVKATGTISIHWRHVKDDVIAKTTIKGEVHQPAPRNTAGAILVEFAQ